jgi:hypothetical protein
MSAKLRLFLIPIKHKVVEKHGGGGDLYIRDFPHFAYMVSAISFCIYGMDMMA